MVSIVVLDNAIVDRLLSTGPVEDDFTGMDKDILKSRLDLEEHKVGQVKVGCTDVEGPMLIWAHREPSMEHVRNMAINMQTNSTLSHDTKVYVVYSTKVTNKIKSFKTDVRQVWKWLKQRGYKPQSVTGNHTRLAICQNNLSFPTNPYYRHFPIMLYVCPEDEKLLDAIKIISFADNQKVLALKNNTVNDVTNLHAHALLAKEKWNKTCGKGKKINKLSQITASNCKTSLFAPFLITRNALTLGQIWQLAKREGQIWTMWDDIQKGAISPYKGPKKTKGTEAIGKKLNSIHCVSSIGGVPDFKIVEVFQKCIDGEIHRGEINAEFNRYKCRIAVIKKVVHMVNMLVETHNAKVSKSDSEQKVLLEKIDTKLPMNKQLVAAFKIVPDYRFPSNVIDVFTNSYVREAKPQREWFGKVFSDHIKLLFTKTMAKRARPTVSQ